MKPHSAMSDNRVQRGMQVKVCGATEPAELYMLDRAGVDYAGLWFNVRLGKYSLDRKRFLDLARRPLRHLGRVGVTTENDTDCRLYSGVRTIGHSASWLSSAQRGSIDQTPFGGRYRPVLHVQRGKAAGVPVCGVRADAFIVDNFVSRQQPGSTGECIPPAAVAELTHVLGTERCFLAGGMDDAGIRSLRSSVRVRGVDIDSGSRVASRIDVHRVHAIVTAAWASDG